MNEKIMFSDKLNKKDYYPCPIDDKQTNEEYTLSENDFYKEDDDRHLESYIEDIDGGDNFTDYCEYIFEILEEEGYWE